MKLFGIGLNKTGTSTLGACFGELGFTYVAHCKPHLINYRQGKLEPIFDFVDRFQAFEDWPWPLMFRELDQHYPEAKFILTIRKSPEVWLDSLSRHVEITGESCHETMKLAYGCIPNMETKDRLIQIYQSHIQDVQQHFLARPNKLAVLCWDNGDGWEQLCAFLDTAVPNRPFPHLKKGPKTLAGKLFLKARMQVPRSIRKSFKKLIKGPPPPIKMSEL